MSEQMDSRFLSARRQYIARQFAQHYGLAMTSGSDIHDPSRLAKGGIITNERILTPKDLVKTLKSGSYTLIENE